MNDLRSKADVMRAVKTSVASMQVCLVMSLVYYHLQSYWIDSSFVSRSYSRVKQRDCKYEIPKMEQR